mgnify:CR=1 FL=1
MFIIQLHNCQFYAHHGLHDEESIVGAGFEVNLSVSIVAEGKITSMKETVNYVTLHDIIKKHFEQPKKLLETLAQEIVEEINETDNRIQKIDIQIKKLNPPITNFTGNVSVSYSKSY